MKYFLLTMTPPDCELLNIEVHLLNEHFPHWRKLKTPSSRFKSQSAVVKVPNDKSHANHLIKISTGKRIHPPSLFLNRVVRGTLAVTATAQLQILAVLYFHLS